MGRFFGKSRSEKRAENNLGIKRGTLSQNNHGMYRTSKLHKICQYVDSTQYDHLSDWESCEASDEHVPIKKRKPRIIYPFAQVLSERVASKLLGQSTFPKLNLDEDEDTEDLMEMMVKSSYLKPLLLKSIETFISHNSMFVRFKIVQGTLVYEYYNPKYCYPEFDDKGDLTKMVIRYVYDDNEDLDSEGNPIKKWYQLELGQQTDILFDNPKFVGGSKPEFQEVSRASHNLGFVQGEWFRNGYNRHAPDGDKKSIVEKCYDFMDAVNYNLSQSDKAVLYGQDPQLVLNNMDEDEIETLIKSSSKGWNVGREGKAQFLEVGGSGVTVGKEHRTDLKQDIQDIARVVMLDPEKIAGSAQSGKAMEILHAPLVELINQMRPHVERGMIKLLQKSLATLVIFNQRGMPLAIGMPPNYQPVSLDITAVWPPIFPPTTQDKQQIVSMFIQLSSGNIISRETALKNIMAQIPDLDIDDIEQELNRVNTQQQFNTFGF